jgi:hypothetical protein
MGDAKGSRGKDERPASEAQTPGGKYPLTIATKVCRRRRVQARRLFVARLVSRVTLGSASPRSGCLRCSAAAAGERSPSMMLKLTASGTSSAAISSLAASTC